MKFKIGQEIKIKEDFTIKTFNDNIIVIKENDKGFLDSKGLLHLTSGKGIGKIVKMDNMEIKGYDYENISKLIFNRLNYVFNISEFLSGEEISKEEFKEEIEDILMDIL